MKNCVGIYYQINRSANFRLGFPCSKQYWNNKIVYILNQIYLRNSRLSPNLNSSLHVEVTALQETKTQVFLPMAITKGRFWKRKENKSRSTINSPLTAVALNADTSCKCRIGLHYFIQDITDIYWATKHHCPYVFS